MSWVQWQGKTWETTDDEAHLSVHLWPPDAACPRTSWSWSLSHVVRSDEGETPNAVVRHLAIDLTDLHFFEPDWRRLAGREIRADAAWHAAGDHITEYGQLADGQVEAMEIRMKGGGANDTDGPISQHWVGHAWVLRCGALDGWRIPCELDAWLIPKEEYDRTMPETAAEVARFPEGPPNLRVIACADFTGGSVLVPRTLERPSRWARRALREVIGCRTIGATHVCVEGVTATEEAWDGSAPGPAATVNFSTR